MFLPNGFGRAIGQHIKAAQPLDAARNGNGMEKGKARIGKVRKEKKQGKTNRKGFKVSKAGHIMSHSWNLLGK